MSVPATADSTPITEKSQLIEHLEAGCKPKDAWRIGTEHEKFAFTHDDLRPLPYEGASSVKTVLEGLRDRFGWNPVLEGDYIIGLSDSTGAAISLEPGGQLELSGAPLETVHQTCDETGVHLQQVKAIAKDPGIGFLGVGFQPKWKREDIPWMPKGRYAIMREYMPKRGSLGLDMMLRTCTVQVNLDFASEADMVKKLRVSLALQPLATALWANSPFMDGHPTDYVSLRSHVWLDTDPDRSGMLPFAFEDGMSFERYVDYALDVPMYFVYRDGKYIDASGLSFRDFLTGRLAVLPGEIPTVTDWADHLTTIFPEVRLKRYLEMRGADGGPHEKLCSLPAFWVGLLYETSALDAAWDLVKTWSTEEMRSLRLKVPAMGLQTPFRNETLRDIGKRVLDIAEEGLRARNRRNIHGQDETVFLDPLRTTIATGRTPAEELVHAWKTRWHGSVNPLFLEYAY